jgi:hypothetical protein
MINGRINVCVNQNNAYLTNIRNESIGFLITLNKNVDGNKTVKIFVIHGDISNQIYKNRIVLRDNGAKNGKLIIKGVLRL